MASFSLEYDERSCRHNAGKRAVRIGNPHAHIFSHISDVFFFFFFWNPYVCVAASLICDGACLNWNMEQDTLFVGKEPKVSPYHCGMCPVLNAPKNLEILIMFRALSIPVLHIFLPKCRIKYGTSDFLHFSTCFNTQSSM